MSRASLRMSAFRMRMHPCEIAAGDQVGAIRAVDADEAAAGPVGQDGRACARPERNGPVERVAEAGELLADVELAPRGRPARLPDADGARKTTVRLSRARPGRLRGRPRAACGRSEMRRARPGAPTGRRVGKDREPHAHPGALRRIARRSQDEHEIGLALRRRRLHARHGTRCESRGLARRHGTQDVGPECRGRHVREARRRRRRRRREDEHPGNAASSAADAVRINP